MSGKCNLFACFFSPFFYILIIEEVIYYVEFKCLLNSDKSLMQCAFLFFPVYSSDSSLSQGHQTNSRLSQVQKHLFSDCLLSH